VTAVTSCGHPGDPLPYGDLVIVDGMLASVEIARLRFKSLNWARSPLSDEAVSTPAGS